MDLLLSLLSSRTSFVLFTRCIQVSFRPHKIITNKLAFFSFFFFSIPISLGFSFYFFSWNQTEKNEKAKFPILQKRRRIPVLKHFRLEISYFILFCCNYCHWYFFSLPWISLWKFQVVSCCFLDMIGSLENKFMCPTNYDALRDWAMRARANLECRMQIA